VNDSPGPPPAEGVPASRLGRVVMKLVLAVLRVTAAVSPRPTALAIRYLFARAAADSSARLLRDSPADVVAVLDERYGPEPDALLDVYLPGPAARAGTTLPAVVWVHGGAFVGGSKEELAGYLRMIADRGFAVVGVRYTRAPEGRYPTPARQVLAALRHLQRHAARLRLDPERIVLAGDSAGAHISAQVAAVVSNPGYAGRLGLPATIGPAQLRGVALCCGIFDPAILGDGGPMRSVLGAVAWAYSGTRDYRSDGFFLSTAALPGHVTSAFPPTFLTVGNTDPLRPQSLALAGTLASQGVALDTLFFPDDHQPPLGHEYQFELNLADGRAAFERLVAFFARCTGRGG
jgi:acetyl esterase/lipase